MDLCEMLGGMTLGELLRRADNDELYLWIARAGRKAKRQDTPAMPRRGR